MPSRQVTEEWKPRSLSLPTSRMSGGTLASVNSNFTGLSISSPMRPHHSSTLTTSSPPQLTTFAGVEVERVVLRRRVGVHRDRHAVLEHHHVEERPPEGVAVGNAEARDHGGDAE